MRAHRTALTVVSDGAFAQKMSGRGPPVAAAQRPVERVSTGVR